MKIYVTDMEIQPVYTALQWLAIGLTNSHNLHTSNGQWAQMISRSRRFVGDTDDGDGWNDYSAQVHVGCKNVEHNLGERDPEIVVLSQIALEV